MRTATRRLLLPLVMALGLILGVVSPASANTNCVGNLNAGCIFNHDTVYAFTVCEDWSGTSADPGCKIGSRTAVLQAKTWSPFYDSDGFYLPAGFNARVSDSLSSGGVQINLRTATGWHKLGNARNHRIDLIRE